MRQRVQRILMETLQRQRAELTTATSRLRKELFLELMVGPQASTRRTMRRVRRAMLTVRLLTALTQTVNLLRPKNPQLRLPLRRIPSKRR